MTDALKAFSLAGKVAIVTGGSAGIGLGIAEHFTAAGAKVLATGRRTDGAAILAASAPGAFYLQQDMTADDAGEGIVAAAASAFGAVDILINNAGVFENIPVADYDPKRLDALCAVNIKAVLMMTRSFVLHRRQHGGNGAIVNISSVEGISTTMNAGMGAYGATKAAIRGMTVSLARELGPEGIRVNAVAPGAIVHDNMLALAEAEGYGRDMVEQGLEIARERTNSGRIGIPSDIANACIFLASAAGDYVSGQTIVVDGGMSVKSC